ncbi:MAG: hypothetical protein ABIR36_02935 [Nitrospiraceae bacterium]
MKTFMMVILAVLCLEGVTVQASADEMGKMTSEMKGDMKAKPNETKGEMKGEMKGKMGEMGK